MIVIPFVQQALGDSPNSSGSREAYADCIFAAFSSLRRWAPREPAVLVTNAPWTPHLPTGVEVVETPFASRPTQPLYSTFESAFFMVDALACIATTFPDQEVVAVVDPDVLFLAPPVRILASSDVADYGLLALDHPPRESINGLSRSEASGLHRLAGHRSCSSKLPARHFGGELVVGTPERLGSLGGRMARALDLSLERAANGQFPWFTTEEHLLSFAVCGESTVDLSDVAKRIWTTIRTRNSLPSDLDREMIHLPSEKDAGLRTIAMAARREGSWFWTAERAAWLRQIGRHTSVGRLPSVGVGHSLRRRIRTHSAVLKAKGGSSSE